MDGMTLTGNRPQTKLDNIEEVQVLEGPHAVLYGGAGASQGGMISVIRKKTRRRARPRFFTRANIRRKG